MMNVRGKALQSSLIAARGTVWIGTALALVALMFVSAPLNAHGQGGILNGNISSTVLTTSANTITYGSSVTLTATVTDSGSTPTGTVTFTYTISGSPTIYTLGSPTLNPTTGTVSLTATTLPVGVDSIIATYNGNSSILGSVSSAVTVTVNPVPTTTTLTSSPVAPTTISYGTSVLLTATVAANGSSAIPQGSVTFSYSANGVSASLGTVALSGGVATLTTPTSPNTPPLPVGVNSITATFTPLAGTGFNASTSSALSITVTPVTTSTMLNASPTTINYGTKVTLTATVTVPPTASVALPAFGTVIFSVNGSQLGAPGTWNNGSGMVTTTVTTLPVGSDSVTACYTPTNADYTSSCSPAVIVTVGATPADFSTVAIPGYGVSMYAGNGTSGNTGNGGSPANAELETPIKTVFDAAGNMYIADSGANVIRMVSASTGLITTVAGGGPPCSSGDAIGNGCAATAATLNDPTGIAIDPSGNLYIADSLNYEVRKVTNPSSGTGTISIYGGVGTEGCYTSGALATASYMDPIDIAFDSYGNAYVPMSGSHCKQVGEISPSGVLTIFVGSGSSSSSVGNSGYVSGSTVAANCGSAACYFITLSKVAVDSHNNVYVGGGTYDIIMKVAPAIPGGANVLTTVVGGLTAVTADAGDGGPGIGAAITGIGGFTFDKYGNIFISENLADRVREVVATTGNIYTIAGGGTVTVPPTTGPAAATSEELAAPLGITVDSNGNLYLSDSGYHEVQKLNVVGFGATLVGTAPTGYAYIVLTDTIAGISSFTLKTDAATPDFALGTVTGCTVNGTTINPIDTGCTIPVTFNPQHPGIRNEPIIVTDAAGNIYQIPLTGLGTAPVAGLLPGTISSVTSTVGLLKTPVGSISTNADGSVFIADTGNNVVRKISPTGAISVFAGNGTKGYTGDTGAATAATLNGPSAVAVDTFGNVYVADTGNNVVRVVNAAGIISTFAGTGTAGYQGNSVAATTATLDGPAGVAVDAAGNVYIADTNNDEVREVYVDNGNNIAADNTIVTIAGNGSEGYAGDGGAATASALNHPLGLAVDPSFNVYIADTNNEVVREILASTGFIKTFAGTKPSNGNTHGGYSGDGGPAISAQLSGPSAVALDAAGNVYIADSGNNVIRQVSSSNQFISTVAGASVTGTAGYTGDGGSATSATMNEPDGVAVDGSDSLYILDSLNSVIRKVSLTTTPTVAFPDTTVGATSNPVLRTLDNLGNLPLTITAVSVPSQFVQQSNAPNCSTLSLVASGAECSILVAFAPTVAQSNSALLVLTDNSANTTGSTQSIALTGKGVSALDTVTVSVSPNPAPYAATGPEATATITVTSSGAPASGATVSYTVTGPATTTGSATTNGSGVATVVLSGLPAGTYTLTVTYSGSSGTGTTTTPTTFVIQGDVVTMNVTYSPAAPTYGIPINVTVGLTSTAGTPPAGTVSYRLDVGPTMSFAETTGSVTFSVGTPDAGTHTLVVCYLGNTQDESLCQTLTIIVAGAPTVTTVSSSVADPYIGQVITFNVSVSDTLGVLAPPAGSITFMDGTTVLCTNTLLSGQTSITIFGYGQSSPSSCPAVLAAGTHSITAVYSGSADFAASTSAVFNQPIAPADFTLEPVSNPTVTQPTSTPVSSVAVTIGQPTTLNVWVLGNNEYEPSGATNNTVTYAYAGTLTLGCSGLPVYMGCSFSPAFETLTNTANSANSYCTGAGVCPALGTTTFPYPYSTLVITTLGPHSSAGLRNSSINGIVAASFLLPGVLLASLLGLRRRRIAPRLRRQLTLLVALLILGGMTGLTGCTYNIAGAPTGTYQINIVGVDSTNHVVRSTPLTVVATQ